MAKTGDIDNGVLEEQRRRKTEKERRTDMYNDSPALYHLVNRSTCLRQTLMDWVQESLSDPTTRLPAPELSECCSVCNPGLLRTVPFPWDITPSVGKPQAGLAAGVFHDRLSGQTTLSIWNNQ